MKYSVWDVFANWNTVEKDFPNTRTQWDGLILFGDPTANINHRYVCLLVAVTKQQMGWESHATLKAMDTCKKGVKSLK